jgi:hypothetical protein
MPNHEAFLQASEGQSMNEQEWLCCEVPLPMLILLRGEVPEEEETRLPSSRIVSGYGDLYSGPSDHVSPRKCRLFIAACLQRLRNLPLDEKSYQALSAYTRYATDRNSRDDFRRACLAIQDRVGRGGKSVISHLAEPMWQDTPYGAASAAGEIACVIANHGARESVAVTCANATEDDWFAWGFCGGPPDPLWQATQAAEEKHQAALLRHIVGNPFRPVTIDPSWLAWNEGTVTGVARGIVEQWACNRMPILADALEDAGCTNEDILNHCRGPGPHVRGCWVLDLILGLP